MNKRKKIGYLILENGKIFEGISFGTERDVSGEVVFNTGMVGYPESFTDPSYYGQIFVATYPLIGNYGVPAKIISENIPICFESEKIHIRGLIVSSYIEDNTHWQSTKTLSEWLKEEQIPALYGIDTRTLTKIIREKGVLKGIITFKEPSNNQLNFYDINKDNLVSFVSCRKIIYYGRGKIKILLIDTGVKYNQIRILLKYNTTIIRVPWNFNPFKEKNSPEFDAIFLCNGPGDARLLTSTINTVKEALERKIPLFGICLGNQILALAAGGNIYKLKYGHRGQNQPVIDNFTRKCFITSQNHGFAVETESLPKNWMPWFRNLNDNTNEGIRHKTLPFFSVQFHPEANPGPTDTEWLFYYFIKEIKKRIRQN